MSTDKKPRTPEELLAGLHEEVELDKIAEEVDAMSNEEVAASLAKHGIDPAERLAKDRAMIERLRAEAPPRPSKSASNVRDITSARRWSTPALLAAVVGGLAVAAGAFVVLGHAGALPSAFYPPAASTTPPLNAGTGSLSDAQLELFLAEDDYVNGEYPRALQHLDRAKAADPAIDRTPSARNTRRLVVEAMGPQDR